MLGSYLLGRELFGKNLLVRDLSSKETYLVGTYLAEACWTESDIAICRSILSRVLHGRNILGRVLHELHDRDMYLADTTMQCSTTPPGKVFVPQSPA